MNIAASAQSGQQGSETAAWYRCKLDPAAFKGVARRTDFHGIVHIAAYLSLLAACGYTTYLAIGTWWVVPALLAYSAVWCFSNSIVHECGHGTAFRTRWVNETVLYLAGIMGMEDPTAYRWLHAQHHSHTQFRDRDPELFLFLTAPVTWRKLSLELTGIAYLSLYLQWLAQHATGRLSSRVRECVPASQHRYLIWFARLCIAIYLIPLAAALYLGAWWPVILFVLPRIIGVPVTATFGITQHVALRFDVKDYRLTTRTMLLNPLFQFLYWNMNFHIEHHMFPSVPFHALPKLHRLVQGQLPPPTIGLRGAYGEVLFAMRQQRGNPDFTITPRLPERESDSPVADPRAYAAVG